MSISVDDGDNNAACIQYNETRNIPFTTISGVEGNGDAIGSTYGIQYLPTYIVIAPDHSIPVQDIWPVPGVSTFINAFEGAGAEQAECGSIMANFSSDYTELCGSGTVQYSDLSEGDITSWEWTFEGGTPETSTEQNPTVTYDTPGTYDVTLTVNGDDGATLTVEDYMSVFEIPDVTVDPFAGACIFWEPYELTGGMPEGGDYSGPGVTDNIFDPESAGLGTHTITYTYISDDGCENSAEETLYVDACTGIDEVLASKIRVYPNPAKDVVHITSEIEMESLSIYNYTGQLIDHMEIKATSYQLNTSSFTSGVYSIKINTEENIISKRLIIK